MLVINRKGILFTDKWKAGMEQANLNKDILVVGAGISGISAALEAAETGYDIALIEKRPYIGGRVAQLNQYFPKLCPPSCGLEINLKRLKESKNIDLYTLAEVVSIDGNEGSYKVKVKLTPRYIKEDCPNIERYVNEINIERDNDFNFGMNKSKALYMPYDNAYPTQYVLDRKACTENQLKYLAGTYPDCIDLDQKEEIVEFSVKSIVWATGWDPYEAGNIDTLGYKEFPEVISNVEMERLSAPNGPTSGQIIVPGSGKAPEKVVFVQCAGSRDENHLEYCSSICCLASMKQARYIREQYPDAEIHIFYIDIRSPGIFEDFYTETKADEKIHFHRGKVAKVFRDAESGRLIVEAENTIRGDLNQAEADMVVLATGMKPATDFIKKIKPELLDESGFLKSAKTNGINGTGVCTRPKDVAGCVQESTGAAIKAIHTIIRNK
ncbi:MAG: FAD-dependent oxidoreductase [Candidatus Kapaibacterium sp.]